MGIKKNRATFRYSFSDLGIDVARIERFMGYSEGESHETVSEIIETLLIESRSFVNIKAEYVIFPVERFNEADRSVLVNDIVFDVKKIVYSQIRKAESIVVFLCTAGSDIGIRSRKSIREGDLLNGYIYDVIGSEIVEAAADLMQENLKQTFAGKGKNITNRYSPGYCGWDVEEQHKLFSFFPYNYCGIRLTPSALMDPVKSISGFIGIGEKVRYNPYTCRLCEMKDCIYRNRKS